MTKHDELTIKNYEKSYKEMSKEELMHAVDFLLTKIKEVSNDNNDLKDSHECLSDKLNKVSEENEELKAENDSLNSYVDDLEEEIESLGNKVDKYESYTSEYEIAKESMIMNEKYLDDANVLRDMFTEYETRIGRGHF